MGVDMELTPHGQMLVVDGEYHPVEPGWLLRYRDETAWLPASRYEVLVHDDKFLQVKDRETDMVYSFTLRWFHLSRLSATAEGFKLEWVL